MFKTDNYLVLPKARKSFMAAAALFALAFAPVQNSYALSVDSDGGVTYQWNLTCDITQCPEEWAVYQKVEQKWRDKYAGRAGRETDWRKVKEMATKSPGCVAIPQQMTDHWRIYLTDYVGPFKGTVRRKHFASFSANKNAGQDDARKAASRAIMINCGYIGNTAGSGMFNLKF